MLGNIGKTPYRTHHFHSPPAAGSGTTNLPNADLNILKIIILTCVNSQSSSSSSSTTNRSCSSKKLANALLKEAPVKMPALATKNDPTSDKEFIFGLGRTRPLLVVVFVLTILTSSGLTFNKLGERSRPAATLVAIFLPVCVSQSSVFCYFEEGVITRYGGVGN